LDVCVQEVVRKIVGLDIVANIRLKQDFEVKKQHQENGTQP